MSIPTIDRNGALATLLAAAAFVIALPRPAVAGPWIPEPGEAYAKLSGSYFRASGVFDREGDSVDPNYRYSHFGTRLYADIGVIPDVGFSASVPFLVSRNEPDNSSARYIKSGFGDLDLATEYGRTFGQVAVSAGLEVRIPLYEEVVSAEAPTPSAYTERELDRRRFIPSLGDGSVDLTPQVHVGASLHPFPGWMTASAGPKFRFQGFGDGIEYAVGTGAFVIPERLALTLRASGLQRFQGGNERPTKSFIQFSAGPILEMTDAFAFEASARYLPTGAFVSKGWSGTAGISYDGALFPNPWGG